MKQFTKRALAWLLVLVMVVLLFPARATSAAALPATAEDVVYVKSGNYIYNWGKRDVTATFLSTPAASYYTGSYTYANLSALAGSSTTGTGFYTSELGKAIHNMLVAKQTYTTSYNALRDLLKYTDCTESNTSKLSSFYSGTQVNSTWDGGSTWNREHTWPNSKGLDGNDENDIMMIRPTVSSENNSRGNTAYGESSGYYNPNGNGQNLHGDVARLMLQHLMRWGNTGSFYGTGGVIESRSVLLKWLKEDPVDTWEMGKNDAVQAITGVRNIFVDYPELAFILLGEQVPANYPTPSGSGTATTYTVTAQSNNTSFGTVSVSGHTVTATPANGYAVSKVEVTAGTATFTRNGNVITVTPTSDCTVLVTFAAKQKYFVTYVANGATLNSVGAFSGDTVSLPTTAPAVSGYTFTGSWVLTEIPTEVSAKPTAYTSYTVTKNLTFYALYSRTDEEGQGTDYVAKSYSALKSNDELVVVIKKNSVFYAMSNNPASDKPPVPVEVLVTNNTITSDIPATIKWTVSKSGDNIVFYPNGDTTKWLYATNANNGMRVGTGDTKRFTLDSASGYLKTVDLDAPRYVGIYTTQDWRCYTSPSQANIVNQQISFFVLGGGAANFYTTSPSCPHAHTTEDEGTPVTCTIDGYTAGVFCSDCNTWLEGHELIPATGHGNAEWISNEDGTHTKTCPVCLEPVTENCHMVSVTEGNTTVFTCSDCGYTYTQTDYYTINLYDAGALTSFQVVPDVLYILPDTGNASGETYTLIGWSTTEINPSTTVDPTATLLTGSQNATANLTLYAVYSFVTTTPGQATTSYQLVTAVSQLAAGDEVVIAAADFNYAISKTQNTNNRKATGITKTSDKSQITIDSSVDVFTLVTGTKSGTFGFRGNAGYLYAASSSSNYLKTQSTLNDNASFKITISGGVATIVAQGANTRNTIQYNNGSATNLLFGCYGSASQKATALYKKVSSSGAGTTTTNYTTNPETQYRSVRVVAGVNSNLGTVAPTLTGTGSYELNKTAAVSTTAVDGYTFLGWYKSVDNGATFTAIEGATDLSYSFTVTENVTLKALYAKLVTVHFLANGGTFATEDEALQPNISTDKTTLTFAGTNSISVAYGNIAATFELTREHYTFLGWKVNGETYTGSEDFEEDTDLEADWAQNYSITVNGGTASVSEAPAGATVTFSANEPQEGYRFLQWTGVYGESNEEVEIADPGIEEDNRITMPAGDVTLTASFTPILYNVSFVNDNGTAPQAQEVAYGSYATEPEAPTASGYRFDGWFAMGASAAFKFSETAIIDDITLYAKWTKLYTITCVNCTTEVTEVAAGTEVTLTTVVPVGYQLTGWKVETDHEGIVTVIDGVFTMPAANVTATAEFELLTFTVTFDDEFGLQPLPQTVEYGKTASEPEAPTAEHYEFLGWFAPDAEEPFDFSTPITADLTLRAKWQIVYTILDPADQTYELTSGDEITFVCDGDFTDFTGFKVNGELLDAANYTAVSGSTHVTLAPDYLESLEAGDYTVRFVYADGESNDGTLTVTEPTPDVPTGDTTPIALYICLMTAALATVLVLALTKKRQK